MNMPEMALLVDDTEQNYRALTLPELAACRRVGSFFDCDRNNVLRLDARRTPPPVVDDERCLFALFRRDVPAIRAACRLVFCAGNTFAASPAG